MDSKLDPAHHGFESFRVRANAIAVHGARTGRGPPLVLLHGWPEFWLTWEPVMARLADRFDLIAPDLRGFGDSPQAGRRPSDRAGAEVHAADLLALLDHLGLAPGRDRQPRCRRPCRPVLRPCAPGAADPPVLLRLPLSWHRPRWAEPAHLAEIWYQSFQQKPWAAPLVGSSREACRIYFGNMLRHWAAGNPARLRRRGAGGLGRQLPKPGNLQGGFDWYVSAPRPPRRHAGGGAAACRSPSRPALWGTLDPVLKVEWADRLPEYFRDPEVTIAEDAGHFVHYETPEPASAAIAAFFERVNGDRVNRDRVNGR